MFETSVALAVLFILSAVTSYVATIIVRHAAEAIGAVDLPEGRRIHLESTPRLGGLAIIFGFGFPLLLLAGNHHAASLVSKNIDYLCAVLAAGALIVGLGVYDDVLGTDAPRKFTVQTAAAVILVAFGFRFDFVSLAGATINLGVLASVVSIVWVVGVINAMNFIDGMDSLATVIAITIAAAFIVIGFLRGDVFSLVIMTALCGSLIGFYRWNKPPAKIFMGDTGSMFIGLLLAACSIVRPTKSPTALIVGGPMLALALPVLDTLIVMQLRFSDPHESMLARIARMFSADKRHIHHILVAKYGSVNKAIASIWLVTLLFAVAAVMTVVDRLKPAGYTLGALGLLLLIFLRYWFRRGHGGEAVAPAARET
jgi:UDP-GlcNAc:undecaprenyl-phosphate GlcNAc-1-phosphate transferase